MTYNVLSLDGGGIRGIISVVLLERLAQEPGLSGYLDRVQFVAGTSTGGLIEMFTDNLVETFDIKLSKTSLQTASLRVHYLAYEVEEPVKEQNAS